MMRIEQYDGQALDSSMDTMFSSVAPIGNSPIIPFLRLFVLFELIVHLLASKYPSVIATLRRDKPGITRLASRALFLEYNV